MHGGLVQPVHTLVTSPVLEDLFREVLPGQLPLFGVLELGKHPVLDLAVPSAELVVDVSQAPGMNIEAELRLQSLTTF